MAGTLRKTGFTFILMAKKWITQMWEADYKEVYYTRISLGQTLSAFDGKVEAISLALDQLTLH